MYSTPVSGAVSLEMCCTLAFSSEPDIANRNIDGITFVFLLSFIPTQPTPAVVAQKHGSSRYEAERERYETFKAYKKLDSKVAGTGDILKQASVKVHPSLTLLPSLAGGKPPLPSSHFGQPVPKLPSSTFNFMSADC